MGGPPLNGCGRNRRMVAPCVVTRQRTVYCGHLQANYDRQWTSRHMVRWWAVLDLNQ